MDSRVESISISKGRTWAVWIVIGFFTLFMAMDAVAHIAQPAPVVDAFSRLGIPLHLSAPLGVLVLLCLALYLIPRTAFLGAILLTGYLGGAVAINLRAAAGSFPVVFPVLIGILLWAGLALRKPAVQLLATGA
jgi:hypothetical protein